MNGDLTMTYNNHIQEVVRTEVARSTNIKTAYMNVFPYLWQYFKFAREDCYMLELLSFPLPQFFTICHELIKQVVNNICLEYLHTQRIC